MSENERAFAPGRANPTITDSPRHDLLSENEEETRAIGSRFARTLEAGDVVALHGDLGSGKTTFTQGIARALGIAGPLPSPTFTLVNEYEPDPGSGSTLGLYHLDLYRLAGEVDLDSFGFDQYLNPENAITVVEWPERAASRLPTRTIVVALTPAAPDQRRITISPLAPDRSTD